MDTFWSKIIVFIIVCVLGFLFVTKVFQPMNQSQALMADQSNATLNAINTQVQSTSTMLDSSSVLSTIQSTCVAGNTTKTISVALRTVSGAVPVGTYNFTTSTTSTVGSHAAATVLGSKSFAKTETTNQITYTEL
ncbi:MAG: hypothetical protein Q8N88_02730 [Nanoarchaeota archaeon]|nr:hypothetical protein [Nanoarchaeota archaeon]